MVGRPIIKPLLINLLLSIGASKRFHTSRNQTNFCNTDYTRKNEKTNQLANLFENHPFCGAVYRRNGRYPIR
jgi:hypothetical protein